MEQTVKTNVDISSMNRLVNNTIEALDKLVKTSSTPEHVIQAAIVVKDLQEIIQKNGLELYRLNTTLEKKSYSQVGKMGY